MRESMRKTCEFVVTPEQWQALVQLLGRAAHVKPDLAQLFSDWRELDFTTENSEDAK
jgi:hypothetical protein